LEKLLQNSVLDTDTKFDEYDVGMSLSGLQNMRNEKRQVRSFLRLIILLVATCPKITSPVFASMALHGFNHMTCQDEEVRNLLSVVGLQVLHCTEPMNSANLGNAISDYVVDINYCSIII
jgi:hypothetical protein